MSWRPIHPNHAIERTRVVVQFKDKLPQKTIQKLGEAFEYQRAEFGFGPRVEVQTHTLTLTNENPSSPMVAQLQARGWQFVREAAPGNVVEALILDPEGLVYENVEYVRWADFWARASQMLLPLISGVGAVTDLRQFSLEYFDRFVFSGAANEAAPEKLIEQSLINTLSSAAKSGEELWHVHRGWYETVDGIRVLINQNIDANDGQNANGELTRAVGVYTKVERRDRSEVVDANLLGDEIVTMHKISKAVFASAISHEVHNLIGLSHEPRT